MLPLNGFWGTIDILFLKFYLNKLANIQDQDQIEHQRVSCAWKLSNKLDIVV